MRNPIQELQAEELEKEEICRDISVSYTHLEVYKRQDQSGACSSQ